LWVGLRGTQCLNNEPNRSRSTPLVSPRIIHSRDGPADSSTKSGRIPPNLPTKSLSVAQPQTRVQIQHAPFEQLAKSITLNTSRIASNHPLQRQSSRLFHQVRMYSSQISSSANEIPLCRPAQTRVQIQHPMGTFNDRLCSCILDNLLHRLFDTLAPSIFSLLHPQSNPRTMRCVQLSEALSDHLRQIHFLTVSDRPHFLAFNLPHQHPRSCLSLPTSFNTSDDLPYSSSALRYLPRVRRDLHTMARQSSCVDTNAGSRWQPFNSTSTSPPPAPYLNTSVSAISTPPPHSTHPASRNLRFPSDVVQREPHQVVSCIGKHAPSSLFLSAACS
jgi:hypothetical protein